MKRIHYPTLLMHAALLLMAKLMLQHYQDGFLIAAGLLLCVHVICSCFSTRSPLLTHLLGTAIQAAVFAVGVIGIPSNLGSGLALLFYQIALGATVLLEAVIALIRSHFKRT